MMKIKFSKLKLLSIGVTLLLLGSWATKSFSLEDRQASTLATHQSSQAGTKVEIAKKVKPGKYCFKLNTQTISASTQLTVKPNNRVIGGTMAAIQDQKEGYYTSYIQFFEGNLNNNQLKVNVITRIEYDTQDRQETWTLTENSLNTGRENYKKVPCSTLSPQEFPRISRIKFAPGKKSAVVENSVVRGSRDIYLISAKAGQTMKVSITSLENNAVFDLIAPNKDLIQGEITRKTLKLPDTGDYEVIVGGTRGNASYKLRVEIN